MKTNSLFVLGGVLVASAVCVPVVSRGAPPVGQELPQVVVQGQRAGAPLATGEVDTPRRTFAELIDAPVYNYQNVLLGSIKAVTADLEQGRLVEVLIGTRNGWLGAHEKVTPVPPTLLKLEEATQTMRLNVSKARFEAAPGLARRDAATYSQRDRAVAASRYFGVRPWFEKSGLGYVETTGEINLMQIKSREGKYLGKVGLILMDLPHGRIRQIVDEMETMNGSGSFVVGPRALRWNAGHTGLVLQENFASLTEKPHFRWAHGNRSDTEFVEQTNAADLAGQASARGAMWRGRERAAE